MSMYSDNIGPIGGFVLENGTEIELVNDDIGTPVECDFEGDVQNTFFTTIDLPNIPIGTPYGWSPEDKCWYYFLADSRKFVSVLLNDNYLDVL